MLLTISIIRRAVRFSGMSSAYRAQSPPLSPTWQSVQLSPSEAEKNPMVPMNRSTGIPLRIWTFLKTSSAMVACCRCAACPPATATVSPHAFDAVRAGQFQVVGGHLPARIRDIDVHVHMRVGPFDFRHHARPRDHFLFVILGIEPVVGGDGHCQAEEAKTGQ